MLGEFFVKNKAVLNWIAVWVILANAVFIVMLIFGAPIRTLEIMVGGIAGLVVRKQNTYLQILAFIGVLLFSVLVFISHSFGMPIRGILRALKFASHLNPLQSPEYMLAIILLIGVIISAYFLLSKKTDFRKTGHLLFAVFAFIGLAGMDFQFSKDMRGYYDKIAPEGAAFSSASTQTQFGVRADTDARNLVLVMLESLGQPVKGHDMSRLLFAPLKTEQIREKYTVTQGTSPYYRSTTSAEVRELCGSWKDYYYLLDTIDDNCLPARLAAKGYEARAYHSYVSEFFDRKNWYSNVGFENTQFFADILSADKLGKIKECPGVFSGLCDQDVPAYLFKDLKQSQKPVFAYWLSLNTHVPVPPPENMAISCESLSPELHKKSPMICNQFLIFNAIYENLAKELLAVDLAKTDILIVGDHPAPFWDKRSRSKFEPGKVPWLYLQAK